MLYVIHGSDTDTAHAKLKSLVEQLHARRPEAEVFRVEAEDVTRDRLLELIESQGLFEQKYIVILKHVLQDSGIRDEVLEYVSAMREAPHVFVLFERALDAKTVEVLRVHAEKVQEYTATSHTPARPEPNLFAVADALGARDKKQCWVALHRALAAGASPEEIHGIVVWQVKAMLLAADAESAKAAGLKPYPYKKAHGFLRQYSRAECRQLLRRLVMLYHDARRGDHELDTALEQFVLTV